MARTLTHRRWVVVPLTTIVVALSLVAPAAALAPADAEVTLGSDQEAFWDGHTVGSARVPHAALCGVAGPCWDYRLRLTEPAARLRVALGAVFPDPGGVRPWPDFRASDTQMLFRLRVFAPESDPTRDDPVAEGSTGEASTAYAVELFVGNPGPGTYTVRIIPESVNDMAFRMRAKLERANSPTAAERPVPPNLRIIPPFEFSFPAVSVNDGPAGATPHRRPRGCMVEDLEEAVEEHLPVPELCLRFSMGFENAGAGRLDLRLDLPCVSGSTKFTTCGLHQRIWASNSTWKDRAPGSAGATKLHAVHGHFHYQNVYWFDLLAVEDGWTPSAPTPALEPVAPGRKLGAFPDNELLADWQRFYQADGHAFGDGVIQLQAGWGDVYEWNRSGNYIDFPQSSPGSQTPKAGFYVVRGVTDPAGLVEESDEADNTSYAFINVAKDGHVTLLERGYGTDPWDPNKILLHVSPG